MIEGAADVAAHFGVSPLIIGLTLVSIGTSAPEILVSATASLQGSPSLAVGNAVGSNLANTGLVLGITALIATIPVALHILRFEMLVMLGVTVAAGLVLSDGYLGRVESLVMLTLMVGFLWGTFRKGTPAEAEELLEEIAHQDYRAARAWAMLILGMVGLVGFANLLVSSAVETALRAGMSELIIGATLVAVGTSLPELAASVASVLKGKTDIALGNVLGSNIFNLSIVLPVAGLVRPSAIDPGAFGRDFLALAIISAVLALFCLVGAIRQRGQFGIGRLTGVTLLIIYAAYYIYLFA